MNLLKVHFWFTFFGVVVISSHLHAQPDTTDWWGPRYYQQKFDPAFQDRIQIVEATDPQGVSNHPSPNGGYGYHWADREASENLALIISVDSGYKGFQITFINPYSDLKPIVRWLNEKLLYIRVFWCEDLGTDMIFNVESGKFISKEMVHDGSALFFKTREQTLSPEFVDKQIAALRLWITPPKGTSQQEVEIVFGKGTFYKLPENKPVRVPSHYPSTNYLLLKDKDRDDVSVVLGIKYKDGAVEQNPWLRLFTISGGRMPQPPGTSNFMQQQWDIQRENLRALDDLLEIEKEYRNALNAASWNKGKSLPELQSTPLSDKKP